MTEAQIKDSEKTANFWSSTEHDCSLNFFGFPPLRAYLIRTAFGEAAAETHRDNPWWAEDILQERYLEGRDIRSVASICCGFGAVEQHLVPALGSVHDCVGLDLAPGAIFVARRRAEEAGLGELITYEVADLNEHSLPEGAFDLVIANGALHHLTELDCVVSSLRSALKPGGLLYACEHVGMPLQDFAGRQLELINAVAWLVAPELRQRWPLRCNPMTSAAARRVVDKLLGNCDWEDASLHGEWSTPKRMAAKAGRFCSLPPRRGFGALVLPRRANLLASDPSEGVSSDRIIPTIQRHFQEVQVHQFGGAVLAYALDSAFYRNFESANSRHRALLDLLCHIEEQFILSGDLPIEHAIIVAE